MLIKPDSCKSCILGCAPFGTQYGYVPAHGTGDNGVLIVLEAAGADEAEAGIPVVGKAGHFLFQQLKRVGIERDGFRIHNVLSCQPPGNKLAKMPYEAEAIKQCAPLLDATIRDHKFHCELMGKTPVILTLGRIAFKRIMGTHDRDAIMRADYQCYPHWHKDYKCWVIAADHPSFLMRGNNHLVPVLQFAVQRAVEIALNGLVMDEERYMCDPDPATFQRWVEDYLRELQKNPSETFLAYDIETPMKQGSDEEKVAKEDDDDYTILRCSFAYRRGEAVSVPWTASYIPSLEALFASPSTLIGWNLAYDSPRVRAQMPIIGREVDAMLAWHVLNSSLPKGLGFVTPFYNQKSAMWKHLNEAQPAFYNAKDSAMTFNNFLGIRKDLKENNLDQVFERHVIQLNEALAYMSSTGVLLDQEMRADAENQLQTILDGIEAEMESAVPQDARQLKVYKKEPKNTEGMVQVDGERNTRECSICGNLDVTAAHFKPKSKKALAGGAEQNPCCEGKSNKVTVRTKLWAKPLEFKISKTSLIRYQKLTRHSAVTDRKEGKVTYDEAALKTLINKYPDDPLYPLIGKHRQVQKLLSTYIGVTQYKEVDVPDDYVLQPGEKWVDAL